MTHTAPPPRVPHRVVGIRGGFKQRETRHWRGSAAATILILVLVQLAILAGHLVWMGEAQMLRWAFP